MFKKTYRVSIAQISRLMLLMEVMTVYEDYSHFGCDVIYSGISTRLLDVTFQKTVGLIDIATAA